MNELESLPVRATVLVVDDEASSRRLMRYLLVEDGYHIEECANGAQALEHFKCLGPDIVLLDAVMPVMDGFETCAQLRQLPGGERTPILMVTGLDDERSVERAFEAGTTDYVTKPIHWPVLRHRLRRIVEARKTETNLAITEARMQAVVQNALDGIITLDVQGIMESYNPAAEQMFGYEYPEILGSPVSLLFANAEAWDVASAGTRRVITGRCKDGSTFPLEISVSRFEIAGEPHFTAILRDITEHKRFEEQLAYLASRDPLTDLLNRRRFREELEYQLAQARRYGARGALLLLDLDHFKDVNDSLGHKAGDDLLAQIARRLQRQLREADIPARLGGDEFAILMPHILSTQAQAAADRVLQIVYDHAVTVGGQRIQVAASIGIALFPEHSTSADELLAYADLAMYQAKRHGRNRSSVYQADDTRSTLQRVNAIPTRSEGQPKIPSFP